MKKITKQTITSMLALSILVGTGIANANPTDGQSIGIGNITIIPSEDGYSAIRNPASMVDTNTWGAFILPHVLLTGSIAGLDLSGKFSKSTTSLKPEDFILSGIFGGLSFSSCSFGSSHGIGDVSNLISTAQKFQTIFSNFSKAFDPKSDVTLKQEDMKSIKDFVDKVSTIGLNFEAHTPIFTYVGSPISGFEIMGKPVYLGSSLTVDSVNGINLEYNKNFINDTLDAQFTIISSAQNLMKMDYNKIIADAQNLLKKMTTVDITNPTSVLTLLSDDNIKLLNDSANLSNSLSDTVKNINDQLKKLSGSSVGKFSTKGDGHLTFMLSSGATVFENDIISLSTGLNLKTFILPYTLPMSTFSSSTDIKGKINLFPIPFSDAISISLKKFQSIDTLNNTLKDVNTQVVTPLNNINNSVKIIQDKIKAKGIDMNNISTTNPADIIALSSLANDTEVIKALNDIQENSKFLEKAFDEKQGINLTGDGTTPINELPSYLTSEVQKDVENGLMQAKTKIISDLSPIGFGIDWGFEAKIIDDILLGLTFENAPVLWPAKEQEVLINQTKDGFQILNQGNSKDISYTISEPFSIKFGGLYNFVKLDSNLKDLILALELEHIFDNTTPFATRFGIQKKFDFTGGDFISTRIGQQIGGIGNFTTLGIGGKFSAFHFDFGTGIDFGGGIKALQTGLNIGLKF